MNRRTRIFAALATALAACVAFASLAPVSGATPSASRCVARGLEPIPVTVRAGAEYIEGVGLPKYEVRWSGKPLPAGCHARRTVAIEVTVGFPHLRFAFSEGLPILWQEFWNGRQTIRDETEHGISNASFRGLECPYEARAKLRYEVVDSDGSILGKRVAPVPVELLPCPARISAEEIPRNN